MVLFRAETESREGYNWEYPFDNGAISNAEFDELIDKIIEELKMVEFEGIKFAPIQEIFYAYKNGLLYSFPIYKLPAIDKDGNSVLKPVPRVWSRSDYSGYSKSYKKWKDATKKQIETYNLKNSLDELELSEFDGITGCCSGTSGRD